MNIRFRHLAAPAVALVAAAVLAACGSGGTTAGSPAPVTPSQPAQASQAAGFNTADVAYTSAMVRLEDQGAAIASLAAGHTTQPQVRQYAAQLRQQAGQAGQQMRGWMRGWHQPAPPPYSPGATPPYSPGPGMMGPGNWDSYWGDMHQGWDQMTGEHGYQFNGDWVAAMILHHRAEIALSQAELRSGASPQARALARTILAQRQAGLAQLQGWRSQGWCHGGMSHGGWQDGWGCY